MDLLIQQTFKLSDGRNVFACLSPVEKIPISAKFQATIRSENLNIIAGPFSVYREILKSSSSQANGLVAFASSEDTTVNLVSLTQSPHFLVLQ